jgi:S1-C subfamily serine protease
MKRVTLGALGLMLAIGTAAAQERMTDEERRAAETRLEQLRQELRELEQKLGRTGGLFRMIPEVQATPWAYTIALGRPRLGVTVNTDADPATDSIGAAIQSVTPDGPAAQAGLQSGDIVMRFNNETLARRGDSQTSPGDRLIELARELDEGDTVRVQYRRGRDTRNATIVARKLDDEPFAYTLRVPELRARAENLAERMRDQARTYDEMRLLVEPGGFTGVFGRQWSDMELTTLDADLGAYFGTTEGLLVVRAPRESFLALKSGDVILRIGGRVPTSPSHAVRILRSYEPGDEIQVDVMRNKSRTEVRGTVPERERERENF